VHGRQPCLAWLGEQDVIRRRAALQWPALWRCALAKPNYSFDKRQREIAKKKQQEEKDARKREARDAAKQASDAAGETVPHEPSTPAS
jgi:hypothetical protein